MKRVLFISQMPLGDCICTVGCLKCFKEMGYETHFFVCNNFKPLFQGLPFIDFVWALEQRNIADILYDPDNEDILAFASWFWIKYYPSTEYNVVWPGNRLNGLPPLTIGEEFARFVTHTEPYCYVTARRLGILKQYTPEINKASQRSFPDHTVLVLEGSPNEACRRLAPEFAVKLCQDLRNAGYNVIFSCNKQFNNKLSNLEYYKKNGVQFCINDFSELHSIISNCSVVVTPGTGWYHVSTVLKRPTVYLESKHSSGANVIPYPELIILNSQSRGVTCSGNCRNNEGGCVVNDFAPNCLRNVSTDSIIDAVQKLDPI